MDFCQSDHFNQFEGNRENNASSNQLKQCGEQRAFTRNNKRLLRKRPKGAGAVIQAVLW